MFWAKQPWQTPSASLKMPPQAALIEFLIKAPSVLTLSQWNNGGIHGTSLMIGALGGFEDETMLILKVLRMQNSVIFVVEHNLVLFHDNETLRW